MTIPLARTAANLGAPPAVNSLFAALEPEFHEAFYDPGTAAHHFSAELYVAGRTNEMKEEQIRSLNSRLPNEICEWYDNKLIGSYELDFLDFALNYQNNRVLSIIGTTGVGKTTFLKHICFHLQYQLQSLKQYRFIYIDLLAFDNVRPTHRDYGQLIIEAVRRSFVGLEVDDLDSIDGVLPSPPAECGVTDIHNLVNLIGKVSGRNLVLIFDNIDQLKPETVVAVSALARAIFVATNQAVVVSLRPPSDSIRVELSRGKATFFPFVIRLPPPNLYNIVWRRMVAVLAKERIKRTRDSLIIDGHGFPIKISNVSERIEILFRNVLYDSLQGMVLERLCNSNVRAALRAFESYFKHEELSFNLIFDFENKDKFPFKKQRRIVPNFNHLLYGVMVGDRHLYSEEARGSVVVNLFEFRTPEKAEVDQIILYLILCVFHSHGSYIKISKVANWMSELGYAPQMTIKAINHFLWRGLLLSPESDGWDAEAENAKISTTGQYYIETLCSHDTYLLNVVFDVELKIASPELSEAKYFSKRVIALGNLIELVALQEYGFLSRLFKPGVPAAMRVFEAIQLCGSLSTKLYQTFSQIRLRHFESDDDEAASERQRRREVIFDELNKKINPAVKRVEALIRRYRAGNRQESTDKEVKEVRLEGLGKIQVVHPKQLVAGRKNLIEMSFIPSFEIDNNELIGSWRGAFSSGHFQEYFLMTRAERERLFKATFALQLDQGAAPFPANSEVSFFDAAKNLGAMQLVAA